MLQAQALNRGVSAHRLAGAPRPADTPRRSFVKARIALDDDAVATLVRRADGVKVLTPELIRAPEAEKHVPWYEKPCNPAWSDVHDVAELLTAISKPDGKFKVVEFYAGWCSSCKGSFQALCKIPTDKKLAAGYEFYKANVEDESLFWWLKRNDIRGLPHMAVWSPTGELLLGTACNFKKMNQVKASLHTILANPTSVRFGFNPEGILEPLDTDSN